MCNMTPRRYYCRPPRRCTTLDDVRLEDDITPTSSYSMGTRSGKSLHNGPYMLQKIQGSITTD